MPRVREEDGLHSIGDVVVKKPYRYWRKKIKELEDKADDLENENYHRESALVHDCVTQLRVAMIPGAEEIEVDLTSWVLEAIRGLGP